MSIFPALFEAAARSAIHLETRDEYLLDDPDWIAWRDGERFDPVERWPDWFNLIRYATSRGVKVRRARIINEPVSDYVRFEHEVTGPYNVAAGEDVRWLPRRDAVGLLVPALDFWIFDDSIVILNHFAGDSTSGGQERLNDSEIAQRYAASFEEIWQRAIPHEQYAI